jgi:hypothetical protein
MLNLSSLIIVFLFPISQLSGQFYAVTDDGKKVILHSDGTWSYILSGTNPELISSVFFGGRKLTSGVRTSVAKESNGLETSISIAKDAEKTMIIFWQETTDFKMNFFNELWEGTVIMYLENGETISLVDRGIKGQNTINDGFETSYGGKLKLYQRYSAYYLTPSECIKLKKSSLSQIAYSINSGFDKGAIFMQVTQNFYTIRDQLFAINR